MEASSWASYDAYRAPHVGGGRLKQFIAGTIAIFPPVACILEEGGEGMGHRAVGFGFTHFYVKKHHQQTVSCVHSQEQYHGKGGTTVLLDKR